MVQLRYPDPYRFTDRERGETYDGPGVFDVPDDAVEQYLERGWEEVDGDAVDASDAEVAVDDSEESAGPDPVAEADGLSDEATADGDADGDSEDDDDQEQMVYEDLTVSEVKDVLASREFSDDELRDMLAFERENKDRKGAIDALEDELRDAAATSEPDDADADGEDGDSAGNGG